jgi:ABC-type transporter Mla maintaining outer membrane lipid asymmetry ATPase subunit MlaF
VIEARELRRTFGERVILEDVSLTIADGELVYLVGASGAGKTVLGRCLFGLLPPDSGSVTIDGFQLVGAEARALHRLRMRYVYVFQHPTLFDAFTVEENIGLPLRYHRTLPAGEIDAAVARWMDLVGVRQYARAYPSEIPFGAQKKVSIARALSMSPRGLILDEPTTGLDRPGADALTDLLTRLHRELGLTCVIISHDRANIVRTADRIVLIQGGRLHEVRKEVALQGQAPKILTDFLGI